MASIHAQKNRAGNTYRVLWREPFCGRGRSSYGGRFATLDQLIPVDTVRHVSARNLTLTSQPRSPKRKAIPLNRQQRHIRPIFGECYGDPTSTPANYRAGLIKLLSVLQFQSNTMRRPVLDAIELVSKQPAPLAGAVPRQLCSHACKTRIARDDSMP